MKQAQPEIDDSISIKLELKSGSRAIFTSSGLSRLDTKRLRLEKIGSFYLKSKYTREVLYVNNQLLIRFHFLYKQEDKIKQIKMFLGNVARN